MIILPDRNVPRSKFIFPVPKKEWMIPSLAQPKDQFGKENRTYFVIRAHVHDGKIVWRGVYEDRDDFDAVLWAIANDTLRYEKELWPLSTPNWDPWIGELPQYSFVTYDNKTSPTGSNQTYDKPSDWNDSNNKIECIGGGASGAIQQFNNGLSTGGGAGAYSRIANFSFTGSSATYNLGAGGLAVTGAAGTNVSSTGNDGGPTYFNATSNPGNGTDNTKCSAAGGSKGLTASSSKSTTLSGGAGGATTLSWGQTKYAGGSGGGFSSSAASISATGGGGAGGSTGAGNNGIDGSASNQGTNGGAGGAGDAGVGSAGSQGTGSSSNGTGGVGGNGTNLSNATVGTGGGGGASSGGGTNASVTAGSGGNYGSGGGACQNIGGQKNDKTQSTSGAGIGGLLVISYTPATYRSGSMFILFN